MLPSRKGQDILRLQVSNFEGCRNDVYGSGNCGLSTLLCSPEIRPEKCIVHQVLDPLWVGVLPGGTANLRAWYNRDAFCLLRCERRGLLSGIGSKESWVLLEKRVS